MARNYNRFFAVLKQINSSGTNLSKEDVISDFTNGRTNSLTDLSLQDFQEVERQLINRAGKLAKQPQYDEREKLRKAIISVFRSINRSVSDAKNGCVKYGVNGNKTSFNSYSYQELIILLVNAKKIEG